MHSITRFVVAVSLCAFATTAPAKAHASWLNHLRIVREHRPSPCWPRPPYPRPTIEIFRAEDDTAVALTALSLLSSGSSSPEVPATALQAARRTLLQREPIAVVVAVKLHLFAEEKLREMRLPDDVVTESAFAGYTRQDLELLRAEVDSELIARGVFDAVAPDSPAL